MNRMRIETARSPTGSAEVEKSFRDRYCERHSLPPAGFVPHVLSQTLYPSARRIRWVLTSDFFGPDREFIHALGYAKSRKAFGDAEQEFHQYHTHGFLRRVFKLRISSNRLRELFDQEFHDPAADTPGASCPTKLPAT